jgi:hypothetical protein
MSKEIEEKLSNITSTLRSVLEQRGDYRVTTGEEGGGEYLVLNNLNDNSGDEPYRCISITGSTDGLFENIEKFRWTFWTSDYSIYNESDLGYDAPALSILDFLDAGLAEENSKSS